jgi:HK97 family phage portal protein
LSLIRRAVANMEARGANPFSEWGMTAPPAPGSVGGAVGGIHVTTESASQVPAVYGCVALLANSVSNLPLRALDEPPVVSNTAKEVKTPQLLERPYEPISLIDWLVGFVWALALRGNYFGRVISRDGSGYPTQIMPINPDVVKPDPLALSQGRVEWRFGGELIAPEDVFHVRYQSMPGMLLGLNPIQVMRYAFGIAHVQDVHTEKFFANSANPQGVIQVKGDMTLDAARKMKAEWLSSHQGPNLGNLPAVLDNESEFKPISITPEDQQLLESRKFSAEQIAGMIFHVPLFMLGMTEKSTSYGRGIEQQERTFIANALQSYLSRAELALTECLPSNRYANFDTRFRIRGDSIQRAEVAYKMLLAGAWCADDARATFDMPPVPDGQGKVFHSPANSELLEMQELELEQAEKEKDEPKPAPVIMQPPANGKGNPAQVPVPAK